jgi:hypothetical protein
MQKPATGGRVGMVRSIVEWWLDLFGVSDPSLVSFSLMLLATGALVFVCYFLLVLALHRITRSMS